MLDLDAEVADALIEPFGLEFWAPGESPAIPKQPQPPQVRAGNRRRLREFSCTGVVANPCGSPLIRLSSTRQLRKMPALMLEIILN
jgi:hypothetical protein